jgi:hypothetical protein
MSTRQDVLELLARGKISIDEAVEMLEQENENKLSATESETIYKVDMDQEYIDENSQAIGEADFLEPSKATTDEKSPTESRPRGSMRRPRWLRVRVLNSETGNNKVSVNIPLAMVKFGLGVARIFSPEMKNVGMDELDELMNDAESGLLVEVQDEESKEHVSVFLD